MIFAFIFSALVWLLAGVYLALLSVASKAELESKFPEYAAKIFRPAHKVITRQGGPVRALALVCLRSPEGAMPPIRLMQALAAIVLVSGALALGLWPFV